VVKVRSSSEVRVEVNSASDTLVVVPVSSSPLGLGELVLPVPRGGGANGRLWSVVSECWSVLVSVGNDEVDCRIMALLSMVVADTSDDDPFSTLQQTRANKV